MYISDCAFVKWRKRVHISKTDFSFLEVREREGILCPGVLHVSHQISRGVCGSLGMDTDAVMDYDCGFTATDEILRVYIKHNT